ncbi:MAG: NAD(P)H-binding protein [Bdellovibrionaceae bacterium]|nr:NAD(P)H-binding protein [Pseudobdellovibrionaceae bacterium]
MEPSPGPHPETRNGPRGALIGATGLVGRQLLQALLADPRLGELATIARRPIENQEHPAWTQMMIEDFGQISSLKLPPDLDFAISCLGSTLKQAGSRENFRRIDFDYNLAFAKLARASGVKHYILLSAAGVSADSRIFYNKVKGELEDAVAALDFPALTIVRPGLLMGERTENRPMEKLFIRVTNWLTGVVGSSRLKAFATPVPELVTCLKANAFANVDHDVHIINPSEI